MGHFALTKHLLPLLIKTSKLPGSSVRIVNVSSMGKGGTPVSSVQSHNNTAGNPPVNGAREPSLEPAGHKISPKPDFSSLEAVNKPLSSTWARYGQSKLVRKSPMACVVPLSRMLPSDARLK